MLFSALLPAPTGLEVQQLVIQPDVVTMVTRSTASAGRCPVCGVASNRVHTRYTRTLADLPWHGTAVRPELHLRRFF